MLEQVKREMNDYLVAALYHFVSLPRFQSLQAPLQAVCDKEKIRGTLLLAQEGINGTIAGPEASIRRVLAYLRGIPEFQELHHKESWSDHQPFYRMKVKLKREIVTMGVENIDPTTMAGEYVAPEAWNDIISDPDVVVVDVRNDYEIDIGSFQRAVNPETTSFTEFPAWVKAQSQPGGVLQDKPKVAMFCTGGIRCEKSTAYLKAQGFDEVYHLQGGILNYLETVPEKESLWEGECFVFDERVSVRHGLQPGEYEFCRGCRHPINAQDKAADTFELGVSCPHCYHDLDARRRERLRERQRQVTLAEQRNEAHIGASMDAKRKAAQQRREAIRQAQAAARLE